MFLEFFQKSLFFKVQNYISDFNCVGSNGNNFDLKGMVSVVSVFLFKSDTTKYDALMVFIIHIVSILIIRLLILISDKHVNKKKPCDWLHGFSKAE